MEHDTCPFQEKNCGKHCSLYIHEHCSFFIIARELGLFSQRLEKIESAIGSMSFQR